MCCVPAASQLCGVHRRDEAEPHRHLPRPEGRAVVIHTETPLKVDQLEGRLSSSLRRFAHVFLAVFSFGACFLNLAELVTIPSIVSLSFMAWVHLLRISLSACGCPSPSLILLSFRGFRIGQAVSDESILCGLFFPSPGLPSREKFAIPHPRMHPIVFGRGFGCFLAHSSFAICHANARVFAVHLVRT